MALINGTMHVSFGPKDGHVEHLAFNNVKVRWEFDRFSQTFKALVKKSKVRGQWENFGTIPGQV